MYMNKKPYDSLRDHEAITVLEYTAYTEYFLVLWLSFDILNQDLLYLFKKQCKILLGYILVYSYIVI